MGAKKNSSLAVVRQNMNAKALATGIVVNGVLTVFKFVIGTDTHCAALVADGFHDLSEVARAVLQAGLRLLSKDMKREHERPQQIVRTEKIISVIVFLAVAYMGLHSGVHSLRDLLEQHDTTYTPALLTITILSIAVKSYMAYHRRRLGLTLNDKELISESLRSVLDCVMNTAILIAALIDHTAHVDIDPWVGLGIGIFIVCRAIVSVVRVRRQRKLAAG
ncbi:MAG: cation transporter [Clostridia bacterium]|nr:cation transporter [Clostridia bacterium]